jgi:predicted nucleotidyltransferase
MKTILRPGMDKILSLFYSEKQAQIHLREIARQTKLNEHSATRFLKQLEQSRTLQSTIKGNQRQYTIVPTKEALAIFAHFDARRFQLLPSIRRNAIQHFLTTLKEQPVIAVLFGSTAKGNFTATSDIDMLLVVNHQISTQDAKSYAESQTGISVNTIQISHHIFKKELKLKEDAVIQSALQTGYPLTNHILYYEEFYAAARS